MITRESSRKKPAGYLTTLSGTALFFAVLYGIALWTLSRGSASMKNKFSALAQDEYMDFLIWQNLHVLIAYVILIPLFAIVLQPFVSGICRKRNIRSLWGGLATGAAGASLIHGFFTLRLMETRPYFLSEAKFGYWYYQILDTLPDSAKPSVFFLIFTSLPLAILFYVIWWHLRKFSGKTLVILAVLLVNLAALFVWKSHLLPGKTQPGPTAEPPRPNIIIIGSDSLRGDRLGANGYPPRRSDGSAAAGVSPRIDALAATSVDLANCYTPIASTLESNTSLMASLYPHTHGLRTMYPDEETVTATKAEITPLPFLLRKQGYDTAAFGDWCAGFYELMPMGMETVSVSSFDNFKIYMSQAVVMAHFVIPLYFDHPLGYAVFPELGSFAQFVTPEVVTSRVTKHMATVAAEKKPFFWHVFYSCNHLPYRSPEPYNSMFSDPAYHGPNKSGVDFDIDSFIGGTDLENKWKALPEKEIQQIRDLYDGCTRQFDDQVGKIIDALKANGLDKNTIILITSDHGDNLYEEGVTLGHGLTFNGGMQANHIPLIFHIPGTAPGKITAHVRSIDIAPTLADLTGLEKPASWEGQSFAPWLTGKETPVSRAFYGETGFPFVQFRVPGIVRPTLPPMDGLTRIDDTFNYQFVMKKQWKAPLIAAKQRCLMTDNWKLICTPTAGGGRHFGLYSRTPDIYSEENLSAQHPEILAPMQAALEKWIDEEIETPATELPE